MWSISAIKERGRTAFKSNYWPSVIVALIMTVIAAGTAASGTSRTNDVSAEHLGDTFYTLTPNEQAIVASFVLGALAIFAGIAFLLRVFAFNHVKVGCCRFYRKNLNNSSTSVGTVVEGFSDYWRVLVTMLLKDLYIFLWSLLFIIPGIMKSYSYRLVPYIVTEYPELSSSEVIELSKRMMQGNRWRSFLLDLSFIGWIILGVITLNVGNILWTSPYAYSTDAALFDELNRQSQW